MSRQLRRAPKNDREWKLKKERMAGLVESEQTFSSQRDIADKSFKLPILRALTHWWSIKREKEQTSLF